LGVAADTAASTENQKAENKFGGEKPRRRIEIEVNTVR
jgi:hypothetical protein